MPEQTEMMSCRNAVTRVYRELRQRDYSDVSAFHKATRLYRLRHPEVQEREARYTVAEWIDEMDSSVDGHNAEAV